MDLGIEVKIEGGREDGGMEIGGSEGGSNIGWVSVPIEWI